MDDVPSLSDIDFDEVMQITGENKTIAIEKTLNAWADSYDYRKRRQAVIDGGPVQWAQLLHDKSVFVRAAIAEIGSEKYQLALVGDSEPGVRDWLARYGTDNVRMALIKQGERDESVVATIAKRGGVEVRKALVNTFWNQANYLVRSMPYMVNSDLKRLADHPNKEVRFAAAANGSKELCLKVLAGKDLGAGRFILEDRLAWLDDVAKMLNIREREMERSGEELHIDSIEKTEEGLEL